MAETILFSHLKTNIYHFLSTIQFAEMISFIIINSDSNGKEEEEKPID